MILSVSNLTRRYAGLVAVDRLDLAIPSRGIHALIGPNGAGKTTVFDLISGITAPSAGRIVLDEIDVTAWPPHRRARLGLSRTFQAIRLFAGMTALETVLVGVRGTAGLAAIVLRLPSYRSDEQAAVAAGHRALGRVGLTGCENAPAASLPYGDQRRLELARALAAEPRLLLLDEPAAGLNPTETARLAALLRELAGAMAILLVEHDMRFVMDIADSVTVLSFGRKLFGGTAAGARADPAVVEAYLGHRLAARLTG